KSANVVFADADIDSAVPALVRSIVQNAGQTCSAGSRLLVHHDVHDEVVSKMVAKMEQITIGHGLDDPGLGPLISTKQLERVSGFLERLTHGTVATGGVSPELGGNLASGAFFAPTLVDDVDPASEIAQDEVFGPVVVCSTFSDDDEALVLANCTN